MKSARARTACRSASGWTSSTSGSASGTWRTAIVCMPNARARFASSRPAWPSPTIASVCPSTDVIEARWPVSQVCALVALANSGVRRVNASMNAITCSASTGACAPAACVTAMCAGTSAASSPSVPAFTTWIQRSVVDGAASNAVSSAARDAGGSFMTSASAPGRAAAISSKLRTTASSTSASARRALVTTAS